MRRFHEEWAIIATIDPIDGNAASTSSDEFDMSKFQEIVAIVMLGVINSSATFDLVFKEATASGGSFNAISNKAITQLTGAGADGAKQVQLGLLPEEMTAGCRYVKATMTNSAHSQLCSVLILGRAQYQPATDFDLASVDEIVT